jgi:hypothetical protein
MEEDFADLMTLVNALRMRPDKPGERLRFTVWNKYSDNTEELPCVAQADLLLFQMEEALRQASRWRALVETGRAIVQPCEP